MEDPDKERKEWQKKYDPRTIRLGMVSPDWFEDFKDAEYFEMVKKRVEDFEAHIGERLPEDLRKYMLYCGFNFYNWSCCGIGLSKWNKKDETDQRPFCIWCDQPLVGTKCSITEWFNGPNTKKNEDNNDEDSDDEELPGLVRFSHEGCGMFKFIAVKGPLKGTIWSNDPSGYYPLRQDKKTFRELLDSIYSDGNKLKK